LRVTFFKSRSGTLHKRTRTLFWPPSFLHHQSTAHSVSTLCLRVTFFQSRSGILHKCTRTLFWPPPFLYFQSTAHSVSTLCLRVTFFKSRSGALHKRTHTLFRPPAFSYFQSTAHSVSTLCSRVEQFVQSLVMELLPPRAGMSATKKTEAEGVFKCSLCNHKSWSSYLHEQERQQQRRKRHKVCFCVAWLIHGATA
jgi:hypothetical protein